MLKLNFIIYTALLAVVSLVIAVYGEKNPSQKNFENEDQSNDKHQPESIENTFFAETNAKESLIDNIYKITDLNESAAKKKDVLEDGRRNTDIQAAPDNESLHTEYKFTESEDLNDDSNSKEADNSNASERDMHTGRSDETEKSKVNEANSLIKDTSSSESESVEERDGNLQTNKYDENIILNARRRMLNAPELIQRQFSLQDFTSSLGKAAHAPLSAFDTYSSQIGSQRYPTDTPIRQSPLSQPLYAAQLYNPATYGALQDNSGVYYKSLSNPHTTNKYSKSSETISSDTVPDQNTYPYSSIPINLNQNPFVTPQSINVPKSYYFNKNFSPVEILYEDRPQNQIVNTAGIDHPLFRFNPSRVLLP